MKDRRLISIGVHVRNSPQKSDLSLIRGRLAEIYRKYYGKAGHVKKNRLLPILGSSVDRLYIGDEFCACRLPSSSSARDTMVWARNKKLGLTLLTPVLTDDQIDSQKNLFKTLHDQKPPLEVTVNDWGVLLFLKERFPNFRFSLGRLLNKGFKDPRLFKTSDGRKELRTEAERSFLNHGAFDQIKFRQKAIRLGIERLEQDLFPYEDFTENHADIPNAGKLSDGLAASCYFPFGYVTAGRVCWSASFHQVKEQYFLPVKKCSSPCRRQSFLLSHSDIHFPLFQNGNTVFYLYSYEALNNLMKVAHKKNLRLVYQDFPL